MKPDEERPLPENFLKTLRAHKKELIKMEKENNALIDEIEDIIRTYKEKEESKDNEKNTENDTEKKNNDWNSAAKKVTDKGRIATYETAFQTALDDKVSNLKYPWDYNEYEMIEKKYTYKNKDGYMVSVSCSKITTKTDNNYHTGYMVMWINKDSMEDLNDCVVTLLEFDGEKL